MWISQIGNTIMRCGGAPAMSVGETAIRAGNTVGWYDSQDLTTLTLGGGNAVSSWRDKLLSGRNLLQATGGSQPIQSANGVLFDGSDDYMQAAFTYAQPVFLYMVFKQVTWTANDIILDGVPYDRCYLTQSSGTPVIFANGGSWSPTYVSLTLDTWGIIRVYFNGASSKMILDAGTPVTGNFGANSMGGITLGSRGNSAYPSNIQVKELVARSSDVSETDIYNYLKAKYSL